MDLRKRNQQRSKSATRPSSGYVTSREMAEFVNNMNYKVYSALKRKKFSSMDKVQVSEAMCAYLKEQHGLTGRYTTSDLLDRLEMLKEIEINDYLKKVVHSEARIFSKRQITIVQNGKEKTITPPSYLSFKLTCDGFTQNQQPAKAEIDDSEELNI